MPCASQNKKWKARKSRGGTAPFGSCSFVLASFIVAFSFPTTFTGQEGEIVNEGIFQIEPSTIVSSLSDFINERTGSLTNDGDLILRGNYFNYGSIGFSPLAEGYTRFEGYSEQMLSGSAPINVKHVLFANSLQGVSFLVDNDVNIYGMADFHLGILDNTNYIGQLTFYENADSFNTSDHSHVNGSVSKKGTSNFVFPIGKGGYYRWGGLSNIPAVTQYTATYFLDNSHNLHSHDLKPQGISKIDNQEFWVLKKEVQQDQEVLISLSWNEATTPIGIYEAAPHNGLTIVRWDEKSNMWIDEGGVVELENKMVTTAIEKDGLFTLARLNSEITLPCNIIVYNAVTPNGDGINDYFQIDVDNDNCAKDLHVKIFNRWGVKVFESDNYGLSGDVFDGYSSGRLTMGDSNHLPSGTYYYILDYQYDNGSGLSPHRKAGYLNLSGN